MTELLRIGLIVVVIISTSGCAIRTPAAAGRADLAPQDVPEEAWPTRWTDDLESIAQAIPPTLTVPLPQRSRDPESDEWETIEEHRPFRRNDEIKLHGKGVIIEQTLLSIVTGEPSKSRLPEGIRRRSLLFISFRRKPDLGDLLAGLNDLRWFQHGHHGLILVPEDAVPNRVAIFTGSTLFGDWDLRYDLVRSGWLVIQIGMGGVFDTAYEREFVLENTALDELARRIATTIDEQAADEAFAAEAFLQHAYDLHPDLANAPHIVVGYSQGALTAPAIAARIKPRISGLVLITGGANILEIAHRTSLREQSHLRLVRSAGEAQRARLSESERRALHHAYLANSRLDPYVLAPALVDTPTLIIHAMFDWIVPAHTGRILHKRLGRPERWSYPLGHSGTLWMLGRQNDRLKTWITTRAKSAADHSR